VPAHSSQPLSSLCTLSRDILSALAYLPEGFEGKWIELVTLEREPANNEGLLEHQPPIHILFVSRYTKNRGPSSLVSTSMHQYLNSQYCSLDTQRMLSMDNCSNNIILLHKLSPKFGASVDCLSSMAREKGHG
jgi:hypothetical protein